MWATGLRLNVVQCWNKNHEPVAVDALNPYYRKPGMWESIWYVAFVKRSWENSLLLGMRVKSVCGLSIIHNGFCSDDKL